MFMNVLLDIILLLIFLLVVIISACRGFVKCIWSMVTIIGAFILAYMFGPTLGEWICDNFVYDYVSSYTYEAVESIVEEKSGQYDISGLFDAVPDDFVDLLEHCGVDINDITSGLSPAMTVSQDELYDIAGSIALPVSKTLSNVVGIITIFFAAILIISLLGLFLKLVVKVPVIKSINSFLGMLLGVAEGFVIVWILCLTIGLFVEHGFMSASDNDVLYLITDGSYLLKFFCELSPIDFINIRAD